jgi:uncharacterized pyridoxal phosphate-containing UPF0001 family protein
VAARLAGVRRRIERAGGDPRRVAVVAVTKGFGPPTVDEGVAAGLRTFGENYAAELLAKSAAVDPGAGVAWHFLGAVQRNKVARLAPVVDCWQSVCRPAEGAAIARHRPGAAVLVQVDIAGLPGRRGVAPAEVGSLVASLGDEGVEVHGLMAVGAPGPPEGSRPGFRRLVAMADELGLAVRSIGMTDDLEVAVAEGSTMVRVGRALFGDRPAAGSETPRDAPSGRG